MKTNFLSKITVLFVAIAVITGMQSCNPTAKAIDPSDLEGFWVLKSFNGKDAKSVFTGALPTLTFDFKEMRISGTGGCNSYTAGFAFEKNVLTPSRIASTMMLCLGDIPEGDFFAELEKPNTLSIENGILTFTDTNKMVVLEFEKGQAPAKKAESISAEQLSGTWNLKKIQGQDASVKFTGEKGENTIIPTLVFDVENEKISGNAGCNTYNSSFKLEGSTLTVGPALTTRMVCPNMEGEAAFLKNLTETSEVLLPSLNTLVISKDGKEVLEFEKSV